jgi:hypothetical protein
MAQTYASIANLPKGPFIGALTKMIVEEAGLHELTDALDAEIQFMAAQQKQQQEMQTQQAELDAGHKATELQLQAQKLATEQQRVDGDKQIELLKIVKDLQIAVAELQDSRESRTDVSE